MGGKLIEIESAKRIIFVGDTHGDLKTSRKIVERFMKSGNKIVFLGDYVDRGPYSKENFDFLLEKKRLNPGQIFLLQGNHEGYKYLKFSPAEFWETISEKDFFFYSKIAEQLPLALSFKNILALHGALPQIPEGEDPQEFFNKIEMGDENWWRICWGDFQEKNGEFLGVDPITGRPQFGRDYFYRMMRRFKKDVLIRSHQPLISPLLFQYRCVTLFSSTSYQQKPIIAILNCGVEIRDGRDLILMEI